MLKVYHAVNTHGKPPKTARGAFLAPNDKSHGEDAKAPRSATAAHWRRVYDLAPAFQPKCDEVRLAIS